MLAAWSNPAANDPVFEQCPRRKYGNVPVVLDGHTFPSKAEARRYSELKQRETAGDIRCLQLQPMFELTVNGYLVCRYVADFSYWQADERIVEDVKTVATRTPQYRIKVKLLRALTGIEVREVA